MRKIEHICGNCRLYNAEKKECLVVILHEGEKIHLPVVPSDSCFFENKFMANGEEFTPADNIKEMKMWVEDPKTGEKINGNGVVKVEYPV